MTVETTDLWRAAYLLANAGTLKDVRIAAGPGGVRETVFVVEGEKEDLDFLMGHYADGNVVGNLARQRRSVEYLQMKARRRTEDPQ